MQQCLFVLLVYLSATRSLHISLAHARSKYEWVHERSFIERVCIQHCRLASGCRHVLVYSRSGLRLIWIIKGGLILIKQTIMYVQWSLLFTGKKTSSHLSWEEVSPEDFTRENDSNLAWYKVSMNVLLSDWHKEMQSQWGLDFVSSDRFPPCASSDSRCINRAGKCFSSACQLILELAC